MDRIDALLRQYDPSPPGTGPVAQNRRAVAERRWLDGVAELVHRYARRPQFRDAAAGWVRDLRADSGTEPRRAADEASSAVTRHAGLLRRFLRTRRGREALKVLTAGVTPAGLGPADRHKLQRYTAPVEALAAGADGDLAVPEDFLQPTAVWGEPADADRRLRAHEHLFARPDDPEPPAVGEFVAGGLVRRVRSRARTLEGIRGLLVRTASRPPPSRDPRASAHDDLFALDGPSARPVRLRPPTPEMDDLAADAPRLDGAVARLAAACGDPEPAARREACAVLTRVYAAVHPAPDLGWLGLSAAGLEAGRRAVRHRLAVARLEPLALDPVAVALGELRRLYAGEPPGRSAEEAAAAGGGLVLVVRPRAVYWDGLRVDAAWDRHDASWRLLLALARGARSGGAAGEAAVYPGRVPARSAMATTCGRLGGLLPADLGRAIVPRQDPPRSYRLALSPDRVHVFDPPAG